METLEREACSLVLPDLAAPSMGTHPPAWRETPPLSAYYEEDESREEDIGNIIPGTVRV